MNIENFILKLEILMTNILKHTKQLDLKIQYELHPDRLEVYLFPAILTNLHKNLPNHPSFKYLKII